MSSTEPLLATEAQQTTEAQTETDSASSEQVESQKQTNQQADDPTAKETQPAEETPLEPYAINNPSGLPEDVQVHETLRDTYSKAAHELKLSKDDAQGLFDTTMKTLHEVAVDEQARMKAEWTEQAKKDSEFGGDDFDKNVGIANKAIREFGTPELKELLHGPSGLSNHPELIRFMFRVGEALSEDRFVSGNVSTRVDQDDDRRMARVMYPNSAKES